MLLEVTDRSGTKAFGLEGEIDEDGGRFAISVRIENERADMSVEPLEFQSGHLQKTTYDAQGFPIVGVETELGPDRVRAGIEMDAERDGDRLGALRLRGDLGEQKKFIEIIDLDHRAFIRRALEDFATFAGSIENDVVARDAILTSLVIFEFGHYLGNGAFLVKDAADRIEVIGLVGPRELNVGIAARKRAVRLTISGTQRCFGEDEERAAMLLDELRDGDAVDFRAAGRRAETEWVARFKAHLLDGGSEVGQTVHERTLVLVE